MSESDKDPPSKPSLPEPSGPSKEAMDKMLSNAGQTLRGAAMAHGVNTGTPKVSNGGGSV